MPCISTKIIYISGYHSDSTISCVGSASAWKRAQNQDFRTPRSLKACAVFPPHVTWWNSSPLAQVQIFPSLSHTGSSSEKHEDDFKIKERRLCLNSPPRGWMWHLGACFKEVLWESLPLVWGFKRQSESVCRVTMRMHTPSFPFPKWPAVIQIEASKTLRKWVNEVCMDSQKSPVPLKAGLFPSTRMMWDTRRNWGKPNFPTTRHLWLKRKAVWHWCSKALTALNNGPWKEGVTPVGRLITKRD